MFHQILPKRSCPIAVAGNNSILDVNSSQEPDIKHEAQWTCPPLYQDAMSSNIYKPCHFNATILQYCLHCNHYSEIHISQTTV